MFVIIVIIFFIVIVAVITFGILKTTQVDSIKVMLLGIGVVLFSNFVLEIGLENGFVFFSYIIGFGIIFGGFMSNSKIGQ
ncbi:hypothetical protein EDC18_101519 [Natranaerovirga pectinivora]|uniref:Uncharacterized protein n=1 Tax=Natranaerovirga pectinivora TaxID=682400 RepID=A0A4R3MPQ7_9FIRM|nr:hypothetical protein [Natranaerovirga pectinivora]TCT17221.1 hypothetical protein EDC18_101519 [Natranaerovirga pectinivora]